MSESMKASIIENENIDGTLVLGVYEGTTEVTNDAGMAKDLKTKIESILESGDFKAKKDTALPVIGGTEGNTLLLGLGKEDKADSSTFRNAGAKLVASKKYLGNKFTVRLPSNSNHDVLAFIEGCYLRDYKYDAYLSKDDDD
ncbi:MAG: M17 family peptidase N-terminal domain-containing protein, partial [Candidatus Thermoplasmatota archaeon]|nr:M17 family peptidase N-terminal domain-containing protein [Candidatus Thermoplasmatota archaeon]